MKSAVLLLALFCSGAASAAGLDVVEGLADVIAAEAFCGLDYDQRAIESFVADNVRNDDLEFTGLLKGLTFAAEAAQQRMSKSAATAHCAQIRRLAARFAFIGD